MRNLKKALSLTLALVLSLALAVPAMAAGEAGSTTIQDNGGFSYILSKPVVGTRIDDQYGITYYQILEGTIITPVVPEGTVKEVAMNLDSDYTNGRFVYILPNRGGAIFYDVGTVYYGPGWLDCNTIGDLEGMSFLDKVTPTQPLPMGEELCISRLFSEEYDTHGSSWSYDEVTYLYLEVVPDSGSAAPEQPGGPVVENIPASGTAKASTQTVTVDGKKMEFQMYALLDANGNGTNYVKLRDMAHVLNGTKAQFAVGYSEETGITVTSGQPYQATGSEMSTPFSGDRAYTGGGQSVQVNGKAVTMTAITLLDDSGGGYNYFKLRDLGAALGFNVDWSAEKGIFVETDKPYGG